MPFYPGPGWGGHCIPLDPSYLSWRVRKEHAHEMRFVELAQSVNAEMPRHVIERISMLLNDKGRSIKGSQILGVGVTYKAGTDDTRGSAGLKILQNLAQRGADISFYDRLVEEVEIGEQPLARTNLTAEMLLGTDLVVLFISQDEADLNVILNHAPLIFDTCNATKKRGQGRISRL
jgi:UDP-N-acetyl-D-glucosamine dehydrogenase